MAREVNPIPIGRVIEKLDYYFAKNDVDGAERHLDYWLKEAENGNDKRGKISILNEQIGLFRKKSNMNDAFSAVSEATELLKELRMEDTVTGGMVYLNAGTAFNAFGLPDEAIGVYQKAKRIFDGNLTHYDKRMGGLYNNAALAYSAVCDYDKAVEFFEKALEVMEYNEGCEPESAITYLNLADLYDACEDSGKVNDCLWKAKELLFSGNVVPDGNYAFVCEKCAPVFAKYGDGETERELLLRAKRIYEGN